jgi:predicted nucleotidyltransferase
MIREIADRRDDIQRLCRRYGVERLDVFGSAAGGGFRAEESDLDFLVEFDAAAIGYADRFLDCWKG